MKITKAQSLENRARIVETASALFRERGYDGVSVADLMAAAGLTHGGFYKHFGSKADLIAETAQHGLQQIAGQIEGTEIRQFIDFYVSRTHRDGRGDGCTMAALGGDAARQSTDIKAMFTVGIENMLAMVERTAMLSGGDGHDDVRSRTINLFAHAVGAVVLSRACADDSPLADEVLDVCRTQLVASLAPADSAQPMPASD
ncbi:TetR/AcrR family transcriptional regulator [Xanthomonas nasturtii]|uniref:TetR/AcrR family transcriptional regulator n=1 Tax=Xanthomonas nasturtii TaxID=1843581 RepID=UPI0020123CB0|nr:TetR/AcrR family transcriptional regulator [Xanthomonas nasturtii]MCL1570010.1 TetR/AcrR family transcriptional regulator [Xanthomonas nasturtii]MCL1573812.1 TetR/AcrR family transcriptional regulator [Xanthomonas nasturtii]MCL1581556.1 TetR/AcrR family transcriptional regulator [Xanthomonas nasturtii]MCL1585358.1 TetR/AcrR family transcriptional regulator [Xanthomonas nasturtii]MCL1591336.1 TetR/AcrR family transcriptional regulator [Xanthomonas nasturtii]